MLFIIVGINLNSNFTFALGPGPLTTAPTPTATPTPTLTTGISCADPKDYPCVCATGTQAEIEAAAQAYLNNCPGGNPLAPSPPIAGVPNPPVTFSTSSVCSNCGLTYCPRWPLAGSVIINLCCLNCYFDLCLVAKHEFNHWLYYCYTLDPWFPVFTSNCDKMKIELTAYYSEWGYCKNNPTTFPTSDCSAIKQQLTDQCNAYKDAGCEINNFICGFCGPSPPGVGAIEKPPCP